MADARVEEDEGAVLAFAVTLSRAASGVLTVDYATADGFGLAFKTDTLWVGTATDGVDGPAGRLAATEAAVTRLRTALEGSRSFLLAGRMSLAPSVEVGLRHDGGDAETGAGMDIGGGLVVSDSATGLSVDLRVRMLLVHQAEGFRERGMALSLSYNPTPSTPLGFAARRRRPTSPVCTWTRPVIPRCSFCINEKTAIQALDVRTGEVQGKTTAGTRARTSWASSGKWSPPMHSTRRST